jgi:hypothetical protein
MLDYRSRAGGRAGGAADPSYTTRKLPSPYVLHTRVSPDNARRLWQDPAVTVTGYQKTGQQSRPGS